MATVKKAVWEWWSDDNDWESFQDVDAQLLEKVRSHERKACLACRVRLTWRGRRPLARRS